MCASGGGRPLVGPTHILLGADFCLFPRPPSQLPLRQSGATATGIAQMGTAIPAAGVQALIGMCEAAALTLQGVRNSIHPNSRHELELQYKAKNDA